MSDMDTVRKLIAEEYECEHILNSLKSHQDLDWVKIDLATYNQYVHGSVGLVIGESDGREILAMLVFHNTPKGPDVRYGQRRPEGDSKVTLQWLPQDEVMKKPLLAPFRYNADASKGHERKFSLVIRWYFMLKGVLSETNIGDSADFAKLFAGALRRIERDQEQEGSTGAKYEYSTYTESFWKTQTGVENDRETKEENSPRTRRSARSTRLSDPPFERQSKERATSPTPTFHGRNSRGPVRDYESMINRLELTQERHLLDNIPGSTGMQWAPQYSFGEYKQKLFVGKHSDIKSGVEIYAYCVPSPKGHEINFYSEIPGKPNSLGRMGAEEVTKQRILHPFNKTYPKGRYASDQGDRARLSLLIKWYYVLAGLLPFDTILREKRAFPQCFRWLLEYIAKRMGDAAAKPNAYNGQAEEGDEEESNTGMREVGESVSSEPTAPAVDEDEIQNSLAGVTPIASGSRDESPAPGPKKSSPHVNGSSRGTKRTAEDADFEDLARLIDEGKRITKVVKAAAKQVEELDKEREKWLKEWQTKRDEEVNEVVNKHVKLREQWMEGWKQRSDSARAKHDEADGMKQVSSIKARKLASLVWGNDQGQ